MFDVRLSSKARNVGLCQRFPGSQAAGLFSHSLRAVCTRNSLYIRTQRGLCLTFFSPRQPAQLSPDVVHTREGSDADARYRLVDILSDDRLPVWGPQRLQNREQTSLKTKQSRPEPRKSVETRSPKPEAPRHARPNPNTRQPPPQALRSQSLKTYLFPGKKKYIYICMYVYHDKEP